MADHDPAHTHDHTHGPACNHTHAADTPAVDPAQQSLADALKVSFWLLRALMIALVIAYVCFSGMYQVAENEAAVVTRFGKIVGAEDGTEVKAPGFHFGLPFPIQEVVRVPTNERTLRVDRTFVYEDPGDSAQIKMGPLNPEKDGSLITGDANLVHARFITTYRVSDPKDFITNVKDMVQADRLVVTAVTQAAVHAVASVPADDVIAGRPNHPDDPNHNMTVKAQRTLDELNTGITLSAVTIERPEMPAAVRDAYELVSQSEAERGRLINEAQRKRTQLLGESAGKAALPVDGRDGPLVSLIKDYEIATALGDDAQINAVGQPLATALRSLRIASIGPETPAVDIGGQTAQIINEAQIARTNVTEGIDTDVQTVLELKASFDRNPTFFKQAMWQDAARQIFTPDSGIEIIYAPTGEALQLVINRDPAITQAKQRAELDARVEAAKDQ
ncbi:MAG: SPFH domain-containing protein [Algisphaera sp.]